MANVDTKILDALKDKEFTIENVLKIIYELLIEEVEQTEKQRANISNKASKANSQDVVKDNRTSVTIEEVILLRYRLTEYWNFHATKEEREMLCNYFGMLNRLQIKGRSNPFNDAESGVDIQYPFNNTITELLRMSNDEFTKFRETMMMMFNTISIVKSSLPKKY